jgi:hypothetical protein
MAPNKMNNNPFLFSFAKVTKTKADEVAKIGFSAVQQPTTSIDTKRQ